MNHTHFKRILCRTAALALAVVLAVPPVYADAGVTRLPTAYELVDGLTYRNTVTENHDRRVESFSLALAPDSEAYPILLQGSGKAYGAASIQNAVKHAQELGYHVLGAVNTDFFVTSTGIPLGISIENGVYISSNTNEDAIAADGGQVSLVTEPHVALTLTNSRNQQVVTPSHFNKARNALGGMYLLNGDFSNDATTKAKTMGWNVRMQLIPPVSNIVGEDPLPDAYTLQVNDVMSLRVTEVLHTDQPMTIGENEFILTCDDQSGNQKIFESFRVGDTVTLKTVCEDPVLAKAKWASGVGDVMVRDGKLTDSSDWTYVRDGRAPRTALGMKADGTLLLYAVDGRQNGYSAGLTQMDLAQEMLRRGCVWAVNLDGGGSTALSVWLPGQSGPQLLSNPSDGRPRGCATYMMLVTDQKGDGKPSRLALSGHDLVVKTGSQLPLPPVVALDNGLNVLKNSTEDVTVYSQTGLGTVENGVYTAGSTPGVETLTFYSPSLEAAGEVTLHLVASLTDLEIYRGPNNIPSTVLTAKPGETVQLRATGSYWNRPALRDSSGVTWSVQGGVGAVDENGLFTAASVGSTASGSVTASAGGFSKTLPFSFINIHNDVPKGHWAYDAVEFCYSKGISSGVSITEFGPDLPITRGDFMVMLHKAMGQPKAARDADFSDVAKTDYWYSAISWAQSTGISSGTGEGRFSPRALISREQAFTMLSKVLPLLNKPIPTASLSVLEGFADRDQISSWAQYPTASLVAQKLVSGTPAGIEPKAPMSRAAMAVMLQKIMNHTPITDVPQDPETPRQPSGVKLALDQTYVELASGESVTLKAALTPAVEGAEITWRSSSPSSATVSPDGVVTNLFAGVGTPSVTITASWGGQTVSCTVICGAPSATGTVFNAEGGLRVRSGPGTQYDIMSGLVDGDRVLVLGETDGWYRIMYMNRQSQAALGYVFGEYLRVSR